ncbi:MAG: CvpA family protein [Prevotellaceae bacterium]|jgi:membrane protein required for colicin V production|nr:CvpA family protein [Prevotellaceae bacterium]
MNYFDIIFALIIIWAAIRGFSTGFIIQLSGLLAMIIGAFVAYKTSFWLADKFSSIIVADPIILNTFAFIITFAVVWGLIVLLGKFLHVVVKLAMLGFINRILGIFFAIVKVVFAMSIILMLLGNLNRSLNFLSKKQTNNSLLYNTIEKFAPAIFPYLKNGFNNAQKQWNENQQQTEKAE